MKKCPDKETLDKLLEFDLSDNMTEDILSHLSSCEKCRDVVRALIEGDRNLLEVVKVASSGQKPKAVDQEKKCFSRRALLAYASDSLSGDQLKLVESHLGKCDNCMFELMRLQRSMNSQAGLDLDMSVLKAAPSIGTQVLEIVLKAKDDLLELVRHTGELLSLTPQFGAIRGKGETKETPIVVKKDLPQKDLSIEVIINRELVESESGLSVSVMKLSNEEFLSGLDVELSGRAMLKKAKTKEDGIAGFSGIKPGNYVVIVARERVVVITIE